VNDSIDALNKNIDGLRDDVQRLEWKIEHNKGLTEIRQIVERVSEKLEADTRRHEEDGLITILTDLEAVKRLYLCKGVAVAVMTGTTVFLAIQIVLRLF